MIKKCNLNSTKLLKRKPLFIWLFIIISLFIVYIFNPNLFSLDFLKIFVSKYKLLVVIIFILIITLISLTLIPSTPFVFSGLLLFSPVELFIYSLVIIFLYTWITFYFAKYLCLDKYLEAKYPGTIKKVKKALKGKELLIISIWGFIPFVPTDLIIYVSSTLRIPFKKCILGVVFGEGILNAIYIFSLGTIFLLI